MFSYSFAAHLSVFGADIFLNHFFFLSPVKVHKWSSYELKSTQKMCKIYFAFSMGHLGFAHYYLLMLINYLKCIIKLLNKVSKVISSVIDYY